MKPTKDHRRIARKRGWYDGHSKETRQSYPYDEIELCIEYECGYYEGLDAADNEINPYGYYEDERKLPIAWACYEKTGITHFFREGNASSVCGLVERMHNAMSKGSRSKRCALCEKRLGI